MSDHSSADEFRLGKEGVVVVFGEFVDPFLDPVGEARRGEDAVAGVDFESVVLRWVVAAGEDDAGGGAQFCDSCGQHR